MGVIETIIKRAEGRGARIVFPEGEDVRIMRAAQLAAKKSIAIPILVGNAEAISKVAEANDISLKGIEVCDPSKNAAIAKRYAHTYSRLTKTSVATSSLIVRQPIIYSALMLHEGKADGMIGGIVYTSGDFIAVCKEIVGLEKDVRVPSSYFIMETRNKSIGERGTLIYADCSVNPNPTAEELADIAVTTGKTAKKLLGWQPRIALLSFSTHWSAVHPDVEKVVKATALAKRKGKEGLLIDGELQGDAALSIEVAKRKIKGDIGKVAGKANVLIFPDLDAGNIAYKLTQEIAGARAYGPVLQGFAKPLSDLSRGATPEDIFGVTAIVAVQCKAGGRK